MKSYEFKFFFYSFGMPLQAAANTTYLFSFISHSFVEHFCLAITVSYIYIYIKRLKKIQNIKQIIV